MNKVTREAVKKLTESENGAAVSLYLPTHVSPTSVHIQEDKTRLKNLIRESEEKLKNNNVDEGVVGQIANALEEILDSNDDFWQHATHGLALFATVAGVQYFHLPIECEEKVSVGDELDVAPLLAVLSYDHPYYLLVLAVHNPLFYKGDAYGIEKVEVDLPESPEAALGIDEMFSNSRTVRAGGGHGPGNAPSGSHGQGDSRQAGQEEQLKFFRIIDDKLLSVKDIDLSLPILLAGTDDEVSKYKGISKLSTIIDTSLGGSYADIIAVQAAKISVKAWQLIEQECLHVMYKKEIEKLNESLGTGKGSTDIDAIRSAAEQGRVVTLMVAMMNTTHDTISDGDEEVTKLVFPEAYFANEFGKCARTVFDNGGRVMGIFREIMPKKAIVAASYRY